MYERSKTLIFTSLCSLIGFSNPLCAQTNDSFISKFSSTIELDSFVVRSGFDTKAFIRRVQTDTTFYKAFKSMHLVPFTSTNTFEVYAHGESVKATYSCNAKQKIDAKGCRITEVSDEKVTGNFFKKNGSFKYYTASLFWQLFYSKQKVCYQSDVVGNGIEQQGKGTVERNKYALKQLIFNPGGKVSGIPFVGDRASIFDEDELKKYDMKIIMDTYEGIPCYKFSIFPKESYNNKVVYNELTTWFSRKGYHILARNYSLSYKTLFYDFNVRMWVRTSMIQDKLYPTYIKYSGDWHIFSQSREHMMVEMKVKY